MHSFQFILLEQKNGIQYITINRPEKLNALNFETLDEIKNAIRLCYDNDAIKAVILTGSGDKSFVAGADINEFLSINEINGRRFAESGQEIYAIIEQCPKPVIAAVNGYAFGGGCELAMACHIRVASENAQMGLPEVTLGIIPGYGGTQRLTQLVGKGRAFELIMTADRVSAAEAWRIGLVNHVVPLDQLMAKCEEIAGKILQRAPIAIAQAIESINAASDPSVNGYEIEANCFAVCIGTEDFREGAKAFIEKRKANFKGK